MSAGPPFKGSVATSRRQDSVSRSAASRYCTPDGRTMALLQQVSSGTAPHALFIPLMADKSHRAQSRAIANARCINHSAELALTETASPATLYAVGGTATNVPRESFHEPSGCSRQNNM